MQKLFNFLTSDIMPRKGLGANVFLSLVWTNLEYADNPDGDDVVTISKLDAEGCLVSLETIPSPVEGKRRDMASTGGAANWQVVLLHPFDWLALVETSTATTLWKITAKAQSTPFFNCNRQ